MSALGDYAASGFVPPGGNLTDLLVRLESATKGDRKLDWSVWTALEFDSRGEPTHCPPYTTSVDAGDALLERIFPGWVLQVSRDEAGGGAETAPKWWRPHHDQEPGDVGGTGATAKTPALAVCAAIIRVALGIQPA